MRPLRIKARVILLTLAPTLTVAILLGAYFTHLRFADLAANLDYRGLTDIEQILPLVRGSLAQRQQSALSHTLETALKAPGVESAALFMAEGKLLKFASEEESASSTQLEVMSAHLNNQISLIKTDGYLIVTAPVYGQAVSLDEDVSDVASYMNLNAGKPMGWIAISLNTNALSLAKYQTLATILFISLLGLAISIIIGLKLGRDVVNPIIAISDTIKALKEGRLNSRVTAGATAELETLKEGINNMADNLSHVQETLRDQVAQATLELRETIKTVEVQNHQLEVARQQAMVASQTKSEFLANMSHEIRTPMNSILGFTELLQQTALNPEQYDYLSTIQKSAQSLMVIINDILDFSKIEAGKLTLNPVIMNLRDNVEDVLTLLAPAAHEKDLQLTLLMYPDVPRQIEADPLRLKQIFTNLIGNAIKFTETGSVIIRIMLSEESAELLTLRVEVQDTGMGLSEADENKLFQAFSQGDTSSARSKGGTGLGLIICKKLLEKMQGEIGLESEPNQGSTFWFTFPTRRHPQTEASPTGLHNNKIAICDSFSPSRLALLQILEAQGAEVQAANDLSALLSILAARPVDAVLLTYETAQDPREFQQHVLSPLQVHTQAPIILLANLAPHKLQHLAEQLGLLSLVKPIAEHKLLSMLYSVLQINPPVEMTKTLPVANPSRIMQSTVLAVDDNPANLKLLSIFLSRLGVRVQSVISGAEAIQFVTTQAVDLIFMDVQMPGMDGVIATQHIKQYCRKTRHNIPIIALTADVLEGQREALLTQGFDDYQSKPVQEADLKRLLNKWLQMPAPAQTTTHADTSAPANAAILDKELGVRLAGGDPKLAREMLAILAQSLPAELTALQHAWQKQDPTELQALAHKLHGGTCYCGTPALKTAAQNLEKHLKTHTADNTEALYRQLEICITQTLDAINNLKS